MWILKPIAGFIHINILYLGSGAQTAEIKVKGVNVDLPVYVCFNYRAKTDVGFSWDWFKFIYSWAHVG